MKCKVQTLCKLAHFFHLIFLTRICFGTFTQSDTKHCLDLFLHCTMQKEPFPAKQRMTEHESRAISCYHHIVSSLLRLENIPWLGLNASSGFCSRIIAKMMKNWMHNVRWSCRIIKDCTLFHCKDSIAWLMDMEVGGQIFCIWIKTLTPSCCSFLAFGVTGILNLCLCNLLSLIRLQWRIASVTLPMTSLKPETCCMLCSNQCLAVLITSVFCQALKLVADSHSLIFRSINKPCFF